MPGAKFSPGDLVYVDLYGYTGYVLVLWLDEEPRTMTPGWAWYRVLVPSGLLHAVILTPSHQRLPLPPTEKV